MSFTGCGRSLLVLLALSSPSAFADEATWQKAHDAGWKAYQEGRPDEAERLLRAAAKEVKGFKPNDPRVATTLDHLAWAFCAQGKFADAEPLAKWALAAR